MSPAAVVSAAFRSGSGTCVSVSLMVHSSCGCSGLAARRDIAPDKFVDLGFDGRAFPNDATVGPLDSAVATLDIRLGQDDQAAGKPALLRQGFDAGLGRLVESIVDPDHEMRRRNQLRKAVADQCGDLAERFAVDQFAR